MLYVLVLITLSLLVINYAIANRDFMHPSVVFLFVFLAYEIVCIFGIHTYAIVIHPNTVLVLTSGFVVMTICNVVTHRQRRGTERQIRKLEVIRIPTIYLQGVFVMQLLSVMFFFVYLKRIAAAYAASYGIVTNGLSSMIDLFDTATKFWQTSFRALAVPIPIVYRITNPLCDGMEYIILYITVNNFLVGKRNVNIWELGVLLLLCVRILMNGSRTPFFRVFTFVLVLLYVFNYRRGKIRRGSNSFLIKAVLSVGGFGFAMVLVLIAMGRMRSFTGLADHLFVYLGAPIVNLDGFLEKNRIQLLGSLTENLPLGAHTFKGMYNYIDKWFHVASLQNIPSIGQFAFSRNGKEIGNVYTMFYKIIYDFGYLGVIPLTLIFAFYYCRTYDKVLVPDRKRRCFDYRLFIYAYLFNDIVMSPFSNRFYETVVNPNFLKFFVISWVLYFFFYKKNFIKRIVL